jgi:CRP-like cAMP-binding protein/molybdopterin/thiamine biosynthesis adenylyltransferase
MATPFSIEPELDRSQVNGDDHEHFYAVLTSRNQGLISDHEQQLIRRATILIAGCGGIGGAAIEPLVRAGAESLVLADNSVFALEDAGREAMRVQDAGRNKATVYTERMAEVNPFAAVDSHDAGLTDANTESLVEAADVIIDGIGAVDPLALQAKISLHRQAKEQGKPVIAGFDVAGTLWVPVYDYRDPDVRLFDGKISEAEVADIMPVEFLSRMFASLKMPIEMVPEFERQMMGQSISPPALGSTALLFGALVSRLVIDLLDGRPVRSSIQLDIPSQIRPRRERLKVAGKRLAMLYAANNRLRDLRRSGRLGVYSPLDDEVFADMREYMEERVWEAGSVIVRQGEPGRDFYVIAEGEVQIELEHDDPEIEPDVIARLGPGEFFGELSLLTDQPRNASVVAASRCRVLSLSRDAFQTYLDESATARQRLAEISVSRIRAAN